MENNKEEILYKHVDAHCWLKSNCIEATFDAMDEYAKQVAIEFKKWCYINVNLLDDNTSEQLYSLWEQTKSYLK